MTVRLDQCPVLARPVWDEDDLLVAADWAMEHGFGNAERWCGCAPRDVRAALFENLDPYNVEYPGYFTNGYLRAAIDTSSVGANTPESSAWYFPAARFSPETLARMVADCHQFERENQVDLYAGYDADVRFTPHRAGRDFWMSRNGSYEGFGAEDLILVNTRALVEAARAFGPFQIYVGDDGLIWFEDDPERCRVWSAYQ